MDCDEARPGWGARAGGGDRQYGGNRRNGGPVPVRVGEASGDRRSGGCRHPASAKATSWRRDGDAHGGTGTRCVAARPALGPSAGRRASQADGRPWGHAFTFSASPRLMRAHAPPGIARRDQVGVAVVLRRGSPPPARVHRRSGGILSRPPLHDAAGAPADDAAGAPAGVAVRCFSRAGPADGHPRRGDHPRSGDRSR
jgi:hypothetical protein